MIKPDFNQPVPADLGVVHFIGIGGSGMSGIARILMGMGHKVTGSDLRDTSNVAALRELGAEVFIGHDEAHLGSPDTVVVTSALWPAVKLLTVTPALLSVIVAIGALVSRL